MGGWQGLCTSMRIVRSKRRSLSIGENSISDEKREEIGFFGGRNRFFFVPKKREELVGGHG